MADRVGKENRGGVNLQFIGRSEIVSPKGEILVRLSSDEQGIEVTEVDLSLANNKFATEYNNLLDDRKRQYYSI